MLCSLVKKVKHFFISLTSQLFCWLGMELRRPSSLRSRTGWSRTGMNWPLRRLKCTSVIEKGSQSAFL